MLLFTSQWHQGIPIEVAPFAYVHVLRSLALLGSPTTPVASIAGGKILTLRMGKMKAGPVVSDNGNFIIDAPFEKGQMENPEELLRSIKLMTGVVEVGLFTNMCKGVLLAWGGKNLNTVSPGAEISFFLLVPFQPLTLATRMDQSPSNRQTAVSRPSKRKRCKTAQDVVN